MSVMALKCRIYPTQAQQVVLGRHFGCRRFVYNKLLALSIFLYRRHKAGKTKHKFVINKFSLCYLVRVLKKSRRYGWLKEVNSQSLQVAAFDLTKAYLKFFKGAGGHPKFKKKVGYQSFNSPQHFTLDGSKLFIPKMKTGIKIELHRKLPKDAKIKNITISMTASGKLSASLNFETKLGFKRKNKPAARPKDSIGLDLGLLSFIGTSNGETIDAPKFLRKGEARIKRLQKRLSKKKNGSKNRAKAALKLAITHEKISNKRNDFLHKLSRRIADENQVIYIENLAVKNMVKNHCLAKSIHDAGWSEFVRLLSYKGNVRKIGRFTRSTGVCECGNITEKLPLSVREWVCEKCGQINDRDIAAAKAVKTIGQELPESKPVENRTSILTLRGRRKPSSSKQESSPVKRRAS